MRKLEARRALAPVGVEEHPRACELLAQLADERARHHGDAILAALPMAHDDLAAREIEILDAQAHAFHRPHPGPVEQAGDQRVRTLHERKHAAHLVARVDRGQPPGPLGPADVAEPGQLDAEREAIREAQRRLGRKELAGSVLYSTSRPCRLCEAAAVEAMVSRMYFGPQLVDAGAPRP